MAESGIEQLKRSYKKLYLSCLASVKILLSRLKIIKFRYSEDYECNMMFCDIVKSLDLSSDKIK
jgi:hypothetical protein